MIARDRFPLVFCSVKVNVCQGSASVKGAHSDTFQILTENDPFQPSAVDERAAVERRHACRYRNGAQTGTVLKSRCAYIGKTVRKRNRGQSSAAGKRFFSDRLNAFTQNHRFQIRRSGKRFCADSTCPRGHSHAFQVRESAENAAGEGFSDRQTHVVLRTARGFQGLAPQESVRADARQRVREIQRAEIAAAACVGESLCPDGLNPLRQNDLFQTAACDIRSASIQEGVVRNALCPAELDVAAGADGSGGTNRSAGERADTAVIDLCDAAGDDHGFQGVVLVERAGLNCFEPHWERHGFQIVKVVKGKGTDAGEVFAEYNLLHAANIIEQGSTDVSDAILNHDPGVAAGTLPQRRFDILAAGGVAIAVIPRRAAAIDVRLAVRIPVICVGAKESADDRVGRRDYFCPKLIASAGGNDIFRIYPDRRFSWQAESEALQLVA